MMKLRKQILSAVLCILLLFGCAIGGTMNAYAAPEMPSAPYFIHADAEIDKLFADLVTYRSLRDAKDFGAGFKYIAKEIYSNGFTLSYTIKSCREYAVVLEGYIQMNKDLTEAEITAVRNRINEYNAKAARLEPIKDFVEKIISNHLYRDDAPVYDPTYALYVKNGTGGGTFAEGKTVTIKANAAPSGQHFKQWNVSPSVTFTSGSATTATASFAMPAGTVTATAIYEKNAVPVTPVKYIRNTKYESTPWNWLMFILFFGWIWM